MLCSEAISLGPAPPKTPDQGADGHIRREEKGVKDICAQGTWDVVI